MANKVYGKHIATYKWCKGETAVLNRTMEVYETKKSIKVLIWNSGFKGWRDKQYSPLSVTKYNKSLTINELIMAHNPSGKGELQIPTIHNYGTL